MLEEGRKRIVNYGNTAATRVVLEDAIPEHTTIVAGSLTTDRGTSTRKTR